MDFCEPRVQAKGEDPEVLQPALRPSSGAPHSTLELKLPPVARWRGAVGPRVQKPRAKGKMGQDVPPGGL